MQVIDSYNQQKTLGSGWKHAGITEFKRLFDLSPNAFETWAKLQSMAVLANFTNIIPDSCVPPQERRANETAVDWIRTFTPYLALDHKPE